MRTAQAYSGYNAMLSYPTAMPHVMGIDYNAHPCALLLNRLMIIVTVLMEPSILFDVQNHNFKLPKTNRIT